MTWIKVMLVLVGYALAPLLHAAQSYPERPIRLIISASPGTGADYFGRTPASDIEIARKRYRQLVWRYR